MSRDVQTKTNTETLANGKVVETKVTTQVDTTENKVVTTVTTVVTTTDPKTGSVSTSTKVNTTTTTTVPAEMTEAAANGTLVAATTPSGGTTYVVAKATPVTAQFPAHSSTSTKRALLIGVLYKGSDNELLGCANDIQNMQKFLLQHGFHSKDIVMLTDGAGNPAQTPTRSNMIAGMKWLLADAKAGDSLFFHFSGHGLQTLDKGGDEDDGHDEGICPVDFHQSGIILDDELNRRLVQKLPAGARLTAVFDCCHSGSTLDLPYAYLPDGTLKEFSKVKEIGKLAKSTAEEVLKGNITGSITNVFGKLKSLSLTKTLSTTEKVAIRGTENADVICFSGAKDWQTAADAKINGVPTGAMSFAVIRAIKEQPDCTYGELLGNVRKIIADHFSQVPQISTGKHMDMSQPFVV
ncbi:caspase domain-containing protein [Entophlyctis helioformis]|nr:caspase domain-containing protein [Entophlyctis helioformis]